MNKLLLCFIFISAPLFADEESDALPERYSRLGLEPLEQVFDFKYRRFRDGDRQSLVVRNSARESFLLVFNQPIPPRNSDVMLSDRNIRAGFTRVCLGGRSTMMNSSTKSGSNSRWSTRTRDFYDSRGCPFRVEAIYPLENMEQENKAIKFLRAND